MKIRLAILECDESYRSRMVSAFSAKYEERLEIYSFTDLQLALDTLNSARIDVLLASDAFEIDVKKLPKWCAFAYLVDSHGIETIKGQFAICKFQKADLIYRQILSIYSEKASSITGFKLSSNSGQLIVFSSPSGGVGTSTMAAACASRYASQNKKVLYLNLEKFGSADRFFTGPGQFDMSDIILEIKKKKPNLPIKLESAVRQSSGGVYFYSQTKNVLDMMELTAEDILRLISEIRLMGKYNYIIMDLDFSLDRETMKIWRQAQAVVMIGDGTAASNFKTERACAALTTIEKTSDTPLTNRVSFAYDKVSSKHGQSVNVPGLKVLGGSPKYADASTQQIVTQLAAMDFFDKIL